jgi:Tfp pilus assembly protein PilF/4-amino-4-deoxy-L-arabinose transferase-like glycosyltransferase
MPRKKPSGQHHERTQRSSTALIVVAILLVGLALRLTLALQISARPEVQNLALDAAQYELFARHVMEHGRDHPQAGMMNPLYPAFLAGVWTVFGESRTAVAVIQAVLDTAVCLLLILLGRRLYGPSTGLWAAGIHAAYGTAVFTTGLLLATSLVTALVMASLVLLVVGLQDERKAPLILAGVVFALASLGRPNLVLVLAGVPVAYVALQRGRAEWRRSARILLLFGLGLVVILGPAAMRNLLSEGRTSPYSTNGGINFFMGNGPGATGRFRPPAGVSDSPLEVVASSVELATRRTGRDLTTGEASAYWWRQGVANLIQHPVEAARLYARKTALFWSAREVPLNIDYRRARAMVPVATLPMIGFGAIAPLALVGLVLLFFEDRSRWLAPLFVIPFWLSVILFFVADRFRLPAVPMLILAASVAIERLIHLVRQRKWPGVAALVSAVAVLFLLTHDVGGPLDDPAQRAIHHHNLAKTLAAEGRLDLAESEYRKALAADPNHAKSLGNLGNILLQRGRYDEALTLFEAAHRAEPSFAGNLVSIGNTHYLQGQLASAEQWYRRALAQDESMVEVHINLGMVLHRQRKFADAERSFRKAAKLDPARAEPHFMIGVLARATGRPEEALSALSRACTLQPGHPQAHLQLCLVAAENGRLELAREHCTVAQRQGHSLPDAVTNALGLTP